MPPLLLCFTTWPLMYRYYYGTALDNYTKSINYRNQNQVFNLSRNNQFCMQDKAKGIQAKYAERIDWPIQTTSCISFPKDIIQIQDQCTRKYEVTELSNVNIYIVSISYKTTLPASYPNNSIYSSSVDRIYMVITYSRWSSQLWLACRIILAQPYLSSYIPDGHYDGHYMPSIFPKRSPCGER